MRPTMFRASLALLVLVAASGSDVAAPPDSPPATAAAALWSAAFWPKPSGLPLD